MFSRLLLEQGAALAHRESEFIFGVACVAGQGDEVMVKLLLNATVSKHATSILFSDAISEALLHGHVYVVKLVLDMCTAIGVGCTDLYFKALVGALYRGRQGIVSLLLNMSISVKKMGVSMVIALCSGASCGHEKIAKLLLKLEPT